MKINFTKKTKKKLAEKRFFIKAEGKIWIHGKSQFETPCDLADANLSQEIQIGCNSYVGKGFRNFSPISIGRFCSIGEYVAIGLNSHPTHLVSTSPFFYHENWYLRRAIDITKIEKFFEKQEKNQAAKVFIADDVWIGDGVKIMNGIKIGRGAIIGAGAVVTKDVEPFAVVVGIPAKKIKYREIGSFGTALSLQDKTMLHEKILSEMAAKTCPQTITSKDFQPFQPFKIKNLFRRKK